MKESRRDTTRARRAYNRALRDLMKQYGMPVRPATFIGQGSPAHRAISPGTATPRRVFATRLSDEARAGIAAEAARVSAILGRPVGAPYVARIFLEKHFGPRIELEDRGASDPGPELDPGEGIADPDARDFTIEPEPDPLDLATLIEARRGIAEAKAREKARKIAEAGRRRACGCQLRGRHRLDCLDRPRTGT